MKMSDRVYAIVVCCLILLALGFSGWYENYVPCPVPDPEQTIAIAGVRR